MADEDAGAATSKEDTKKIVHTYPMVKYSDMNEELRTETIELFVTACEKYATNNEQAAKLVKETMDKKFGVSWHVVVGEGFGFEVSYQTNHILYMYYGGTVACCVWKCC